MLQTVYSLASKQTWILKFTTNQTAEKNVTYLLNCPRCQTQYYAKPGWPFCFRLNNNSCRIKSMDHRNSIFVEQHFRPNRDTKFMIIERIEMK